MEATRKKKLLVGVVVIEVISAVFAWRDLGRRTERQIRGTKRVWRVLITANPGNSLVYWAVGRR